MSSKGLARLLFWLTAAQTLFPLLCMPLIAVFHPDGLLGALPFLITIALSIGMLAFWIRHVLGSPLEGSERTLWIVLIIFASNIGQLVYAWRYVLSGEFDPIPGPMPSSQQDSWDSLN